MSEKITSFDVASYLTIDEDIYIFLKEAADTGNTSDFIHALNTAVRAKGMSEVAKKSGVTRASLYKSLSEKGNPRFDTINKVCQALGFRLSIGDAHKTI